MILNKLITEPKDVLHKVLDSIERRESLLLTYLNQHCFNIYHENKDYRKLLDAKFDVYQADLGIYFALKYLRAEKINRIDATAMNEMILIELIKRKISIVLVGGNYDEQFVSEETRKRGINLAGYKNGYFEGSQTENIIHELKDFDSQVFIVGMGVPRQELFAAILGKALDSKVIICVGNFFEFYFGTKKRAPVFIRKIGFEWMFRLMTEPRRLWTRYIIGIPVFFYRIIKIKFTSKST